MDWTHALEALQTKAVDIGLKALGGLAIWIVGGWLVRLVVRLVGVALSQRHIDTTVAGYVSSAVGITLRIALVLAVFGYFGVEMTAFAALIAGVGIAVGTAWGGLLANFAAGAFLVVLRPFKVGDFVTAGGVTGTVEEVGLFVTTINTPDNIRTFVGNNKVFGDTIQNFSANPHRRVDLVAQLGGDADPIEAAKQLKARIAKIPNVLAQPEPVVVILSFTLEGPVLAVRPSCHNDHYWQVYFDTNAAIREVLGSGAFPAPMPVMAIRNVA